LVLIITQGFISCVIAADYELLLDKDTFEFEIKAYDDSVRLDNVGSKYNDPSLLFGGDADIIGAKSKITIKEWDNKTIDVYEFLDIFYNDENLNRAFENNKEFLDNLLESAELGKDYETWMIIRNIWDKTECKFPILKDPNDFENLLEEVNKVTYPIYLATFVANGDDAVTSAAKAKDALLTGNYLTWLLLVKKNISLLNPTSDYFNYMKKSLKAYAFDIEGDMIIINARRIKALEVKKNYTVEITLNSDGTTSSIGFKDVNNYVFFSMEITSPIIYKYIILIFFTILTIAALGFTYLLKKRKLKSRALSS
jgi:hypothetical protein